MIPNLEVNNNLCEREYSDACVRWRVGKCWKSVKYGSCEL